MKFGVAWYPEQWPEERWPEDLRLMREAQFNTVRMAEFAWSALEPEEGRFELDWLERAVGLAATHGLQVVLGTPSAAPPAWLTQRYPEVLQIDESGRRATHGYRQHYSPASETYRRLASRIAGKMAELFGQDARVIGWQIDNEFSVPSYDEDTRAQFQSWLRERYGDLELLNVRWGTRYWSQTYSDWAQIPLPIGANRFSTYGHNPCLVLEWRRFSSVLWRRFQGEQIAAIRAHADPSQWITHNFMGFFDGYDPRELSEDLDFATWDNYTLKLDLENALGHDYLRGLKGKNFWVMETQPGSCGHMNALDKGEVRRMAWQAVGHGADAVLYWQWRACLGSTEQYHGTLLAQDGTPRPIFREIAQIGAEFARAAEFLRGTQPRAEVALLYNADDRWAIQYQPHHLEFDPLKHLQSFYAPLRARGVDVDIVHPDSPLEGYKLVIAPHLHTLNEARAAHLEGFVRGGGHLVLGPRSGFKNADNALLESRQPAWLSSLLGVHVEEYYALAEPVPVDGAFGEGRAQLWAEWIEVDAGDIEVLARYNTSNGWLDAQAAITSRAVGAGRTTFIGAWLDAGLMASSVDWLLETSRATPPIAPSPGIEVCFREKDIYVLVVLINHSATEQKIDLPRPGLELFSNQSVPAALDLPPGDVTVLFWKRNPA
jgi:beta-galactosidase